MNVLRSLKHRPFALLWAGQTTSRLGDSLYRIALAWWVLEKTGSATSMGTVLVFSQIPMLLFLLVGGVVVDRLPRIRVMFVSDILSGLVITFVAIFSWLNLLQVWHIYIASMVFGFVEAFFFPAYQAVIPEITPPELLMSANSLNGLSQRVTGIVGPSLGAALVAAGGTSLTFGLEALSLFISALFVLPMLRSQLGKSQGQENASETVNKPKPAKEAFKQGLLDLREGFRFIVTVPWIWISILLFGFVNITEASPRAVAMPFLIKRDLSADVGLLGLLGSAASLGFVIGMFWLGQYARLHRRGWLGYPCHGDNRGSVIAICIQVTCSSFDRSHVHWRTFHFCLRFDLDSHFAGNGTSRVAWASLFHRCIGFVRIAADWLQPGRLGNRPIRRTDCIFDRRIGYHIVGVVGFASPRNS